MARRTGCLCIEDQWGGRYARSYNMAIWRLIDAMKANNPLEIFKELIANTNEFQYIGSLYREHPEYI